MSTSLPSRLVYAVDVPEVKSFVGKFVYNYFVHDECTSDVGIVPQSEITRRTDEYDSDFIQYASTRVPRYVSLNWEATVLSEHRFSEARQRNVSLPRSVQYGSLIGDNLDKVLTEDTFSSDDYVAVNFHDGELDDKLHQFVSGSLTVREASSTDVIDSDVSAHKASSRLNSLTPKSINPAFLNGALSQLDKSSGARFFKNEGVQVIADRLREEKDAAVNVQISSRFVNDIINDTIVDPHSPFASDVGTLSTSADKLQRRALSRRQTISELDYKTFVKHVGVMPSNITSNDNVPEIVGYIVDKVEIFDDGTVKSHPSIVIDNPKTLHTLDFNVKYGSRYAYAIRAIAHFVLPAIDDDSGTLAFLKLLISSRPSNKTYVVTEEHIAPPPPADFNFTWDYERINSTLLEGNQIAGASFDVNAHGSLMIHWAFPPNSQRDIKQFQVFRRKDVESPFELIKAFDFNDSDVPQPSRETMMPELVEKTSTPYTFYYDDDFKASESKYIYAVVAIDAHGFTSNYSEQFEVWFDQFSNKLKRTLVSHSGAPMPYPNMYINVDAFVDTIRTSGSSSRRAKLYFNPDFYSVVDGDGRTVKVVSTKQDVGSYVVQVINLDNQRDGRINVSIDDRTTVGEPSKNKKLLKPSRTVRKDIKRSR
jgi:hypothetical protein